MTFQRFVNAVEVVAVLVAGAFVIFLFVNEPDSGTAGDASPGAAIFASSCASCHGADGGGGIGPQLAGRVTDVYPDAADEVAVVRDGRSSMPSFEGDLTPEEIEQVVEYTRTGLGG